MVISQIRFAVNESGINKDWDKEVLTTQFVDKEGTLPDIVDHVKKGHALCAGLLGGRRRNKDNFKGSQLILIDVDNSDIRCDQNDNPIDEDGRPIQIKIQEPSGKTRFQWVDKNGNYIAKSDGRTPAKIYSPELTLEAALENPLIKDYCSLIYTSFSHREYWHRFRLVFLLPQLVTDIDIYESAVQSLMSYLPHDPNCKDGVRAFYGNTDAQFPLFNPDISLTEDFLRTAIRRADYVKELKKKQAELVKKRREEFDRYISDKGQDVRKLVWDALKHIEPRRIGSGDRGHYLKCIYVLMALSDYFPDDVAILLAENWSPSIPGTTWNIPEKMRSFHRDGIGVDYIFRAAVRNGYTLPPNFPPILLEKTQIDSDKNFFGYEGRIFSTVGIPELEGFELIDDLIEVSKTDDRLTSYFNQIKIAKERYKDPVQFEFALDDISKRFGKRSEIARKYIDNEQIQDLKEYNPEECVVASWDEILKRTMERDAGIISNEFQYSGFKSLDEIIEGFQRKTFNVWGGRPSMGKTMFVLIKMALNMMKKTDEKILILSLETPKEQIIRRMVSSLTSISVSNIKLGKLNADELVRIEEAHRRISTFNFCIREKISAVQPMENIESILKQQIEQGPIAALMIDHFQLLGGKSKENRVQELSYYSKTLKEFAVTYDIPIHALAQLNRNVESRNDKRPLKSDLRDSGSIEQDADVICLFYRDAYYNKQTSCPNILEIEVAKSRDGRIGTAKLKYNLEIMNLWELDENEYVEEEQWYPN